MNNWNLWWIKNEVFLSKLNCFDVLKMFDGEDIFLFLEQLELDKEDVVSFLNDTYPQSDEASNWIKINNIPYADYSLANSVLSYDEKKMIEYNLENPQPDISFKFTGMCFEYSSTKIETKTVFDTLTSEDKEKNEIKPLSLFKHLFQARKYDYMGFPALKKSYPSNGSRHPIDLFAIYNNNIIYLSPLLNDWEIVRNESFEFSGNFILLTCTYERMQWKYRNHIFYRDILMELGHIKQNIELLLKSAEIYSAYKQDVINIFKDNLQLNNLHIEVLSVYAGV